MYVKLSYENIIENIVFEFPELQPLLEEHLRDQDGQILQHVFFGDLTRYIRIKVKSDQTHDNSETSQVAVLKMLTFLEKALLSEDLALQELVKASFLENLSEVEKTDHQLVSMMPPALKEAFHLGHLDDSFPL